MRTARAVYAGLIALHPAEFRMEFGQEMLALFDEARDTYSAPWLLWDAVLSVLRQRVLREQEASRVTAGAGLRSGVYPFDGSYDFKPGRLAVVLALSVVPFLPLQPVLSAAPVLHPHRTGNTILYYGPAPAKQAQECACSKWKASARATVASRLSAR